MGYIVVTMVLVLAAAAAAVRTVRDRKRGGCGGGCRGCANAPYCHPEKKASQSL